MTTHVALCSGFRGRLDRGFNRIEASEEAPLFVGESRCTYHCDVIMNVFVKKRGRNERKAVEEDRWDKVETARVLN
jgi:hypothetical protein